MPQSVRLVEIPKSGRGCVCQALAYSPDTEENIDMLLDEAL
jgi:hypothetical protein